MGVPVCCCVGVMCRRGKWMVEWWRPMVELWRAVVWTELREAVVLREAGGWRPRVVQSTLRNWVPTWHRQGVKESAA